jgi:hypothetical protein
MSGTQQQQSDVKRSLSLGQDPTNQRFSKPQEDIQTEN